MSDQDLKLFLDTSKSTHIAILNSVGEVLSKEVNYDYEASKNLDESIQTHLKGSNIKMDHISEVILGIGPGSFTGLRVGIAYIQGLSFTKSIPIVPISSLELISLCFEKNNDAGIIPAKKNYLYVTSECFENSSTKNESMITENDFMAIRKSLNNVFINGTKKELPELIEKYSAQTWFETLDFIKLLNLAKTKIKVKNGVISPNYVQAPSAQKIQ